jgi:hypothetical protein
MSQFTEQDAVSIRMSNLAQDRLLRDLKRGLNMGLPIQFACPQCGTPGKFRGLCASCSDKKHQAFLENRERHREFPEEEIDNEDMDID